MKTFFRFIARSLAVFSAILFVISALIAVVLFSLERRLFNPDTYTTALEKRMVYERLPGIMADEIVLSMSYDPCKANPMVCEIEGASDEYLACLTDALGWEALDEIGSNKRNPTDAENNLAQACIERYGGISGQENLGEGGPPQFFKNLRTEDWEFILATLMPQDDSKVLIEAALDQVFQYLDGDSDMAVLPLGQLKARLTGPEGIEVLERLITTQPACTEEDLARMKASIEETLEGEMILCNPPEDELRDMLPRLQEQLFRVVADMPDKAILIQPPDPGSTGGSTSMNLGRRLMLARTILRLSPLIPLGFLILVTLFAVRSMKGWLRWWGIPLIIVGGIGIVVGLLVTPLVQFAWMSLVHLPAYMSPDLSDLALELLTHIVRSVTLSVVLVFVFLTIIGVGANMGAFFIRSKFREIGNIP